MTAVTRTSRSLSIAQLAGRLSMTQRHVHAMLIELEREDHVVRDSDGGWRLSAATEADIGEALRGIYAGDDAVVRARRWRL